MEQITQTVLLCNGPLVNYRTFKTSAPSKFRGILKLQFEEVITNLDSNNAGKIERFRTDRSVNESVVFIKH